MNACRKKGEDSNRLLYARELHQQTDYNNISRRK